MSNQTKKSNNYIKLNINEDKFNDDEYTNKNECLICYEKVENKSSKVSCNLCSNIFHYKCYKAFIKKSKHYEKKCCHCSTYSLKFKITRWWNYCW